MCQILNASRCLFQSILITLLFLTTAACAQQPTTGPSAATLSMRLPSADYADPNSCLQCHAEICDQWAKSDHAHSMNHATKESVLGNFQNQTFLHIGFDDVILLKDSEIKAFLNRLESCHWDFDPRREYKGNPDGTLRHNIQGRKSKFSLQPCFDDLALATFDAKSGVKEKLRANMTEPQAAEFDAEIEYRKNLRMSRPGDIAAAHDRIAELLRKLVDEKIITTPLGTRFRMFLDGTKYMIETDQGTYEVLFTLGIRPLQQYLVALPNLPSPSGGGLGWGHLQALPVAWDCVENRWFHLYPKEQIVRGDPLHWMAPLQNWNRMCADCHATNLQKNFSPQNKEYKTTYSEINVACAACHEPCEYYKSRERSNAERPDQPGERSPHSAALRSGLVLTGNESVDSCAFCHARRRLLKPGFKPPEVPAADWFVTELQDGNIYFPDGQLLEEAFEHGSFLQSKMSSKGVGCAHCHDPHTLELRYEGNRLCSQCHTPSIYDTPKHHFHTDASKPGTQCVECHFPQSNYMVGDPRRDHSIRKPSPALTLSAPANAAPPNACSICHQDRNKGETLHWAAGWVERWYADKRKTRVGYNEAETIFNENHYSWALESGRRGDSAAAKKLLQIVQNRSDRDFRFPIRASALTVLGRLPQDFQTTETILAASLFAIDEPLPQMRLAAVGALGGLPDDVKLKHLPPLLNDSNLAVRTEAARVLARLNTQLPKGEIAEAFERAKEEYKSVQSVDNDQPAVYLNLAVLEHDLAGAKLDEVNRWFYASVQNVPPQDAAFQEAQGTATGLIRRLTAKPLELYRQSLSLDAAFIPSRVNLAMLHHERGEIADAEKEFRAALKIEPENGDIAYSLGLLLVETGKREEAVNVFRLASENFRKSGNRQAVWNRVRYNLGLLLMQLERNNEAEKELLAVLQVDPRNVDFLYALVSLYFQQGNRTKALPLLDKLIEIQPDNPQWKQMKSMPL